MMLEKILNCLHEQTEQARALYKNSPNEANKKIYLAKKNQENTLRSELEKLDRVILQLKKNNETLGLLLEQAIITCEPLKITMARSALQEQFPHILKNLILIMKKLQVLQAMCFLQPPELLDDALKKDATRLSRSLPTPAP